MLLTLRTTWASLVVLTAGFQAPALHADSGPAPVEPILPIPDTITLNHKKSALGEKLYSDTRLSHDSTESCASCHRPDHGGAEDKPVVNAPNGQLSIVNTPTVLNALYNYRHGWLGTSRGIKDQVNVGLHYLSTDNGGTNWQSIITERIDHDSDYHALFQHQYRDGVTVDNISDALTEYVRSQTTPDARFDRYLRGDDNAISDDEKRGYALFKEYGCVSCHQGVNVGGNLYQKFGIFYDYIAARGNQSDADKGRYNETGRENDLEVFRVPSLRNVELTPPYLHDGSAQTLEQAVAIMGKTQLGKSLDSHDIELIVKFLRTLTGKLNSITNPDARQS